MNAANDHKIRKNQDIQKPTILSINESGSQNSIITKSYPAGIIISGESCQCRSEVARAVDQPLSELIAPLVDAWFA